LGVLDEYYFTFTSFRNGDYAESYVLDDSREQKALLVSGMTLFGADMFRRGMA